MAPQIKYTRVDLPDRAPTFWAYGDKSALDRDLQAYYGSRYEQIRRTPINEQEARTHSAILNSPLFTDWKQRQTSRRAVCLVEDREAA